MRELTMDEMASIVGGGYQPREGSLECALAGASFFLSAAGFGISAAVGPVGWLMGSYLFAQTAVSYYGFVSACSALTS